MLAKIDDRGGLRAIKEGGRLGELGGSTNELDHLLGKERNDLSYVLISSFNPNELSTILLIC